MRCWGMIRSPHLAGLFTFATILCTAAILLWMGREMICTCGTVKLWHGETVSSENSQHIWDWYTPSHVLHGILFYGLLYLIAGKIALGWRVLAATLVEAAWEILENTEMVIEHYRSATIALDYYGDSVLNSTSDILAMLAGFCLARFVPVRIAVLAVVLAELVTLYIIRDGLALNIIMLLYPLDAIKIWQGG